MLPSVTSVLRAHEFITRSRRLGSHRDEALIAEALRRAAELASGDEQAEPAALLFALSVHGRALGDGWEAVPWMLARNQARILGLVLECAEAEEVELVNLRLEVAQKRGSFEQMRAWVAAHLRPMR